jgi:type IV pilus assembly protein PilM
MGLRTGATVGLDIGSSAVRVARVGVSRSGLSLLTFGQAALPAGAVVEGEVKDQGVVAETIARLMKRMKVKTKKAVIGIANQRVVVRQVELPFLEEKEFRASLRFQAADHIPMPVDAAELDYQIIDEFEHPDGTRMMRVLLIAAASDMVEAFIAAAGAAGIGATGVDLTPFAVARAVSPAARGESGIAGAEAVIDVGATVTSIVVHHNGEPRFVRILAVGGDDATRAVAEELDIPFDEAEAVKLDIESGGSVGRNETVILERLNVLVNEIRGSLDYYLSQNDSETISSVVLTGGGSLTPGLLDRLEKVLEGKVTSGRALADMNVAKSGLTAEQVALVEPVAAAAVGLARGSRVA